MKQIKKVFSTKKTENKQKTSILKPELSTKTSEHYPENSEEAFFSELDQAVMDEDYDKCKILTKKNGLNPFAITSGDGYSPFHRAVVHNFDKITELFLTSEYRFKNDNINKSTLRDQLTSLHLVMSAPCLDVLQLLLKQDDLNLSPISSELKTPLDLAKEKYHQLNDQYTGMLNLNKQLDDFKINFLLCINSLEKAIRERNLNLTAMEQEQQRLVENNISFAGNPKKEIYSIKISSANNNDSNYDSTPDALNFKWHPSSPRKIEGKQSPRYLSGDFFNSNQNCNIPPLSPRSLPIKIENQTTKIVQPSSHIGQSAPISSFAEYFKNQYPDKITHFSSTKKNQSEANFVTSDETETKIKDNDEFIFNSPYVRRRFS